MVTTWTPLKNSTFGRNTREITSLHIEIKAMQANSREPNHPFITLPGLKPWMIPKRPSSTPNSKIKTTLYYLKRTGVIFKFD